MEIWQQLFMGSTFRIFDFKNKSHKAEASFALDDALALSVSDGANPAMRLWVHDRTIVLGIPDARLPHLEAGLQFAKAQGYRVIVRNSGGLAVVLDTSVLNISLILPGAKRYSIYECFDAMVYFVKEMLRDLTQEIEAYEIKGSYCPGDYDLSIGGKKFAGISQRRVKEGAAIQIYLDISGNSRDRAALVRDFYAVSLKMELVKNPPPEILPETMASLSELLGQELTVTELAGRAKQTLVKLSSNPLIETDLTEAESASFAARSQQMEKRNADIQSFLGKL